MSDGSILTVSNTSGEAIADIVTETTSANISASAPGDAKAAGSSTKAAKADHKHSREAFGSGASTASAFGDAAADGTATTLARADHKHGREANPVPTGGTTGQVLTKNSNTSQDISWATPSGGGASFPLTNASDEGFRPNGIANDAVTIHNDASAVNGLILKGGASGSGSTITTGGHDGNLHLGTAFGGGTIFIGDDGSTTSTGNISSNTVTVNNHLDMNSNQIINVLDPSAPQHGATKNYIDTLGEQAWTDVVGGVGFQNSWVDSGGAFAHTGFRKDGFGRVDFRVSIKSGASASVAFTFPAGYRPAATQTYAGIAELVASNVSLEFSVASTGAATVTFVGSLTGNVYVTGSFWNGQ